MALSTFYQYLNVKHGLNVSLTIDILLLDFFLVWCVSEERGQWAVYYSSIQRPIITFRYPMAYQLWGL